MNLTSAETTKKTLLKQFKALAEKPELNAEEKEQAAKLKTDIEDINDRMEHLRFAEMQEKSEPAVEHKEYDTEVRKFSISKLIASTMSGSNTDGGRERELCQEAAKQQGNFHADGFTLPRAVVKKEFTSQTSDTNAPTPYIWRGDQLVGLLRNSLVARRAGFSVLESQSQIVRIPKLSSGASAGVVAEGTALPTGDLAFAAPIEITPKRCGVIVSHSREAMLTYDPAVDSLLTQDIVAALQQKIDEICLLGNTTPAITGITGAVTAETGATNGTALTIQNLTGLRSKLYKQNRMGMRQGFILNHSLAQKLQTTVKFANTDSATLMQNNAILASPVYLTNALATRAKGSAPNTSNLIFSSAFEDAVLALFGGVTIMRDEFTRMAQGEVRIKVEQSLGTAFKRTGESFAYIADAIGA